MGYKLRGCVKWVHYYVIWLCGCGNIHCTNTIKCSGMCWNINNSKVTALGLCSLSAGLFERENLVERTSEQSITTFTIIKIIIASFTLLSDTSTLPRCHGIVRDTSPPELGSG